MKRHEIRSSPALSRRDFLLQGGVFLGAAALAAQCRGVDTRRLPGAAGEDPLANARAAGLGDRPILMALNAGITAPNPHNTQAWKFQILSPTEALLYVDETRLLPATDPIARQIHLGQGCLLETTEHAASLIGYRTRIALFPEGYRPATDIGKKPVARIRLEEGAQASELAPFIHLRHTVRSSYGGPMITAAEFAELRRLTRPQTSQIRELASEAELRAHLERHMAGFELEVGLRRTAEESRQWMRIGTKEIFRLRDGISLRDNGVSGFQLWLIENFILDKDPESYYDPAGQKMFLDRYRQNLFTVRGHALFISAANDVRSWVEVGREYARYQLAATKLGLAMRPMSQLMQEFPEMQPLREEYNRFNRVASPAKIQINALLGRAESSHYSPRRPLAAMIRD